MKIEIQDQQLVRQIEGLAASRQQTPEAIVAEALQLYAAYKQKTSGVSFLLSIAGQGHSGQTDVSTRDEEILSAEVDPVRGWKMEPRDADTA